MLDVTSNNKPTSEIVNYFFRHESARIVSHLSSYFGTNHLEEAEDAVQEALIKAMNTWPYRSVPKNPAAWILTVARNEMIDNLRHTSRIVNAEESALVDIRDESSGISEMTDVELDDYLKDDVLKMMFACCHPLLSVESQIILTLRILCGLGNKEVARALLKTEEAVYKAHTRAKQRLKSLQINPEVPSREIAQERMVVILKILYLLFNEGYKSSSGDYLLNKD